MGAFRLGAGIGIRNLGICQGSDSLQGALGEGLEFGIWEFRVCKEREVYNSEQGALAGQGLEFGIWESSSLQGAQGAGIGIWNLGISSLKNG